MLTINEIKKWKRDKLEDTGNDLDARISLIKAQINNNNKQINELNHDYNIIDYELKLRRNKELILMRDHQKKMMKESKKES